MIFPWFLEAHKIECTSRHLFSLVGGYILSVATLLELLLKKCDV